MGWDALEAEVLQEFSEDRRTGSKFKALVDFDERLDGLLLEKKLGYTTKTKRGNERMAGWGRCEECEKPFKYSKKGKQKRFCSHYCIQKRLHRKQGVGLRVTKKCLWCGFSITDRHVNARFCTTKCRRIFSRKLKNRVRPILLPKECARCGKVFTPKTHADTKFCSADCNKRSYQDRRYLKRKESWFQERECGVCSTKFMPKTRRQWYCQRKCWRKAHRVHVGARCVDHNLYGCKVCLSNSGSASPGQSSFSPSSESSPSSGNTESRSSTATLPLDSGRSNREPIESTRDLVICSTP